MTDADIRAILARAEAATEGPWILDPAEEPDETEKFRLCVGPDGVHFAEFFQGAEFDGQSLKNAQFASCARTDIPALCRDLLAAREALRRLLYPAITLKKGDAPDFIPIPIIDKHKKMLDEEFANAALGEEVKP